MLSQAAQRWFEKNLEEVGGENLVDITFNLIQWAEAQGRLRDLAAGAIGDRPKNKELVAVMTSVLEYLDSIAPKPWYQPPTPYEACFLRRKRAVLDRREFNSGLKELVTDEGARTLVVDGAAGSGRSFSIEILTFVAQTLRSFEVASVDLVDEGPGFTPDDLVIRVVTAIGRSASLETLPKTPHEQASRRNVELANWLTGELRAAASQTGHAHYWIVVDGFDKVSVDEDTLDLVMRLAKKAETTEPTLRVVLLACSNPLPPDVDGRARREQIAVVDRFVIEDFFNQFVAHTNLDADTEAVENATQLVLDKAPPPSDPEWLCVVSRLVAAGAEEMMALLERR
jgi:hypothetical protein